MPLPASPIFRDMIILRVSIGDCMLKELLAHLVFRRLSRDQAAAQIEKKSGMVRCAAPSMSLCGSALALLAVPPLLLPAAISLVLFYCTRLYRVRISLFLVSVTYGKQSPCVSRVSLVGQGLPSCGHSL